MMQPFRPTALVLFMHTSERSLKATDVSHGTTCEHGSVFTHGPAPWNSPKHYLVDNVQKN
jgi:hypothetical protein